MSSSVLACQQTDHRHRVYTNEHLYINEQVSSERLGVDVENVNTSDPLKFREGWTSEEFHVQLRIFLPRS